MTKTIVGIMVVAVVAMVSAMVGGPGDGRGATLRGEAQSESADPSGASDSEHVVPDGGVADDDLSALIAEALQLSEAADQAGGLEMQSAAFHQFPGDPFGSIYTYPVHYGAIEASGSPIGLKSIKVDVRPEEVLTAGVIDASVGPSSTHAGYYDVVVRFSAAISPYAKNKQIERDAAIANSRRAMDQGVALVHNNAIYGDFTYGEIHEAMDSSNGWVTVVKGTDLVTANAIAVALAP